MRTITRGISERVLVVSIMYRAYDTHTGDTFGLGRHKPKAEQYHILTCRKFSSDYFPLRLPALLAFFFGSLRRVFVCVLILRVRSSQFIHGRNSVVARTKFEHAKGECLRTTSWYTQHVQQQYSIKQQGFRVWTTHSVKGACMPPRSALQHC